jgi:hypothetical protein
LKDGAPPKVGYWADGMAYGGPHPIPLTPQPAYFARTPGGFLYTQPSDGGDLTAHFIGDDGTVLDQSWSIAGGFGVSPYGNVVAFATTNGHVVAVQDGGSRYFDLGLLPNVSAEHSWSVVAVTGENCSGRSEDTDCTVYAEDNGVTQFVAKISPHQDSVVVHPSLKNLIGVNPNGLVAGTTSISDTGSCSVVLDNTDKQLWKTCDYSFDMFSPDGRFLLGGPAYRDGSGDGSVAVLDATTTSGGKDALVSDLSTASGAVVVNKVWEDATHYLAVVGQGNKWGVVRIGLDGSRELALPVVQGTDDGNSTYVLG